MSSNSKPLKPSGPLLQPVRPKVAYPPQTPPRVSYYTNAVYYPNWKVYRQRPPSSMSLSYISHIFYAFAWPNADGTISLSDEFADEQIEVDGTQGCINAVTQLKQFYPELRIILSIGGGGTGSAQFPRIAHDQTLRMIFASSAKALVDMYGFDGIDIDWEHPSTSLQGADYISLLQTARNTLTHNNYIITSALPATPWFLRHINLSVAASLLSHLNLMGYDFYGPWTSSSGHHSQLYSPHSDSTAPSIHSAITYLLQNHFPSSKIVVGIPCYARTFPGATGPGQPYLPVTTLGSTTVDDRTIEYCELPLPGSTAMIDTQLGASYCVHAESGFVSYDSVATVRMKARYVQQMSLGGLFYWTGPGDVRGPSSLVEAGYNALHDL